MLHGRTIHTHKPHTQLPEKDVRFLGNRRLVFVDTGIWVRNRRPSCEKEMGNGTTR
jgi:hypothetical protein